MYLLYIQLYTSVWGGPARGTHHVRYGDQRLQQLLQLILEEGEPLPVAFVFTRLALQLHRLIL